MRPKKRSKAAKNREQLKKRRIDPCNTTSDGSQYAPSDGGTTNSSDAATGDKAHSQCPRLDLIQDTLYGLWESGSDGVSESDGEIMLEMDDSFDENDWDPGVVPDLYPIFTESAKSFKSTEKALRAPVHTQESRTTSWRRRVAAEARAKEAKTCGNIRSFFSGKKDAPLDRQVIMPTDTPPDTQKDIEHTPTISYSITISDDPESSSDLQKEAPTTSRLSPSIHELARALESQNPPNWRYRSPKTLSPSLSSRTLNPLSQSPSLEPNSSKLPEPLPFEDELNTLALDRDPDPPLSPILHGPSVENAPIPQTSPPPPAHNPQAHQALASLQANSLDPLVEVRLKELRKTLTSLKKQLEAEMRKGKTKVDPRDLADIQALFDYCILAEQLVREGARNPEMSASLQIARTKVSMINKDGDVISKGTWYARTLRSKAKHVRDFGQLPVRKQGKGGAHVSLLDNPSVLKAVNAFVDKCDVGKVTPHQLATEVNTKILPPLMLSKSTISENTAKKWLLKLGFRQTTYKKGIYMDGHERPDVVAYRAEFLSEVATHELYMQQYSDKDCEPIPCEIPPGKRQIIPAFHDECCFHANEQTTNCWIREGQSILRQKSRGRLIHVSDIIVEETGRLVLSEEEIEAQRALPESVRLKTWDARKIIYPGKNHDAYWDMPQLIAQIKDAIKIFEVKFPRAQMLLFVDQSSAHNAYAADALNARKMNVTPGGKQPLMHDTTIPLNNPNPMLRGRPQVMTFPATHHEHSNQPKGMEQIIKERGLWELLVTAAGGKRVVGRCKICKATATQHEKNLNEAQTVLDENPELFGSIDNVLEVTQDESLELDNNSNDNRWCCMEKCLSTEADFKAEKPLLQLVVEEAGHLCILLPKFHCELNPIEMYWGYAKNKFRGQCNGSFSLAKELVPKCLDACPIQTIRRFFQKAWRYMDAYRKGLTGVMAEHAVKKFTSHRKISKQIMMEVAMLVS